MARREAPFPIVGVGASAGGVEALEGFFRGVPENSGCGFVVVTHLNPERRSLLPEIVGRYTSMPVHVAADGAVVAANEVHILPPDAILDIENGKLRVRKPISLRRERKPIDIFFSALAMDQGECAAGVVLSGGDGDGTLGVKAIKERGGLTIAQSTSDSSGPNYPDMPESAIASGMVDIATPAEQMGTRLVEFAASLLNFERLMADERRDDDDKALNDARHEICAIIRNQLGHDFAGYKGKTFLRRVQRRMQVNHLDSLEAYIERLRQEPKEVSALFRDLLINVTNFFRDADAFKVLEEQVIPKLFAGRGAEDAIRVWVPGCATGEEVFSIAILMQEHMQRLAAKPRVQIFATDIDDHALSVARAGRYPEALLDSVSEERRKRFFTYDDGSYLLTKDVRDICVFSPHSVIRDPPFSRLDLVSCRNLLIYFGADMQNQVIPTFHYALKPGGYLFLGTSENVSQFADLFTAIDKKNRVFRSREDASRVRLPLSVSGFRPAPFTPARLTGSHGAGPVALRQSVEGYVLERFAPAHVVVNRDGDIVFYSARTGKYLEAAPGAPSRQLSTLARKGLRLDLRTSLREAIETDARVERSGIVVEGEDDRVQRVDLVVEPMRDSPPEERLFLILFTDVGPMLSRQEADNATDRSDESYVQLERELRDTRERLQSLIEEYETALEELKSSNEELVSVNEEVQSTNEELEASKEELQSVNEELHTVNAELNGKVDQLDRANLDLTNLFESTRVATVFLDRDLVIRSFTPAVSEIFKIRPSDRGRPLTDLAGHVELPGLQDDIRKVFATGETVERAVDHESRGAKYLLRLVPYKDSDKISGVVLTFVDVTTLANAEAHQQVLIAELNHRVKNMLAVVISIAEHTYKDAPDAKAFKDRLVERIKAMAKSYELLARENWTETLMRDLVKPQLAPYGPDRVALNGPQLRLNPKQALSVGMVLHELATNAGKYGALSQPDGRVELSWDEHAHNGAQEIQLAWREIDGPPVSEERNTGFGLKLIERETVRGLGGACNIRFDPTGLQVSLSFPKEAPNE
ncbi:MAG TPA: CheR family methyltransferase [Caulobacteraceae bacterium]|jgi:two-component system CheB/CheR fusion protein|nr:CheR family methyltransferase [Caulobacteraceae bacterium]